MKVLMSKVESAMQKFFFLIIFLINYPLFAQTCRNGIPESTPSSRFVVQTNNTVTDTLTGLIWKRCVEGQTDSDCSGGTPLAFGWQEALEHARVSNFAGFNNWRLPNIIELQSIIEEKCIDPAMNVAVFPYKSSFQNNDSGFPEPPVVRPAGIDGIGLDGFSVWSSSAEESLNSKSSVYCVHFGRGPTKGLHQCSGSGRYKFGAEGTQVRLVRKLD